MQILMLTLPGVFLYPSEPHLALLLKLTASKDVENCYEPKELRQ